MNPIKLIPFSTRERIRVLLFGRNHHQDVTRFAASIGVETMFDAGAERGYEAILAAKAGIEVFSFEPNQIAIDALWRNANSHRHSKGQ